MKKLVVRDKSPRNVKVSDDFIRDFVKWQESKDEGSLLADVFGVNLSREEVNEKIVKFLYKFSAKLNLVGRRPNDMATSLY